MKKKEDFLFKSFYVLGIIGVLIGIIVHINPDPLFHKTVIGGVNIYGVVFGTLGLFIVLTRSGFILNEQEKKLIKYAKILGLTIWTKETQLPSNINKVIVGKRDLIYTYYYRAVIPSRTKISTFDVYFERTSDNKLVRIFSVEKKEALIFGELFADFYKVELILKFEKNYSQQSV